MLIFLRRRQVSCCFFACRRLPSAAACQPPFQLRHARAEAPAIIPARYFATASHIMPRRYHLLLPELMPAVIVAARFARCSRRLPAHATITVISSPLFSSPPTALTPFCARRDITYAATPFTRDAANHREPALSATMLPFGDTKSHHYAATSTY